MIQLQQFFTAQSRQMDTYQQNELDTMMLEQVGIYYGACAAIIYIMGVFFWLPIVSIQNSTPEYVVMSHNCITASRAVIESIYIFYIVEWCRDL